MDIVTQLMKASLFQGLSRKNIDTLKTIAIPKIYKNKQILFIEGDQGHFVYLLCFGLVRLYKTDKNGKEIDIKLIQPGDIFGEVILFEEKNYPVSAVTVQNSDLLLLPRHDIQCLLQNNEFRDDFIGMLMKKLRYLTDKIYHLTSGDVRKRFFLFLTEHYGKRDEYIINFSKQDMAKAIGTNPETLSRLIAQLKKEKIITWTGQRINLIPGYWENK